MENSIWLEIEELRLREIFRQQSIDYILFGISGIELTENTIRNMTINETLEVIDGQADKETDREDSGRARYLQN